MKRYLLALGFFALNTSAAYAGIDDLYSPLVEKNWLEVEYKGSRTNDSSKAFNNAQTHELEFEYGFTDHLMVGLVTEGERASGESFNVSGYGLEAIYTTTKQGEWWLSSGLMGEYIVANHDGAPDAAEAKLLLSREQGPATITANLIFGREVGNNRSSGVGFESAVQATYDLHNEHFTPGIEWFGEYGKLNRFDNSGDQEHYVGPIVTGEIADFDNSELEYLVGYYVGLTDASANNGARIQLSYELKF